MPDPDFPPPSPVPPAGTYIGIDFGLKRIGLASGNSGTATAMPLTTVANHHGTPAWAEIDAVIDQWQPVALVVGRPVQMDGAEQPMTREADGFARRLRKRYPLPVFAADERHTSIEAGQILKHQRRTASRGKTNKADIDRIAAALLLQRWLETHFS